MSGLYEPVSLKGKRSHAVHVVTGVAKEMKLWIKVRRISVHFPEQNVHYLRRGNLCWISSRGVREYITSNNNTLSGTFIFIQRQYSSIEMILLISLWGLIKSMLSIYIFWRAPSTTEWSNARCYKEQYRMSFVSSPIRFFNTFITTRDLVKSFPSSYLH